MIDQDAPISLEAIALACERDERWLFEDLAFTVQAGAMLQVAGPNGCGKTTLLRVLCGLITPSMGSLLWCGHPVRECVSLFASSLLWIGHNNGLKPLLTPVENLTGLCALHRRATIDQQIQKALSEVGLCGFEDVPCETLSAGQQRRVALARLYLDPPPLWILDEPFTALDRQGVTQLEHRFTQHCDEGGVVIFTTHHQLAPTPTPVHVLQLGG